MQSIPGLASRTDVQVVKHWQLVFDALRSSCIYACVQALALEGQVSATGARCHDAEEAVQNEG